MKRTVLLLFILFLTSCSYKNSNDVTRLPYGRMTFITINDVKEIPQNAQYISHLVSHNPEDMQVGDSKSFHKELFIPWQLVNLRTKKFDIISYSMKILDDCYQENLQKCDSNSVYIKKLIENANFESIDTMKAYGVILNNTDLRIMPTKSPCFSNIRNAGEGYPFDNIQNSYVYTNTPVYISHLSRDKAWAMVETSGRDIGFVPINDVAILDKISMKMLMGLKLAIINKDDVPLYDDNGNFVTYSKLGMPIFIKNINKTYYQALFPYINNVSRKVMWKTVKIQKSLASVNSLDLTQENVDIIISNLLGQNYGWGGYLGNRDCSAMIRDYFRVFGIELPRNSKKQSQMGEAFNLSGMTIEEKQKTIIKYGIPFRTILYAPGHVVLYVGNKNNKILIVQNVWGIKTKHNCKDGRNVIGRTIISSLNFGKELKERTEKMSFIHTLSSMNVL